MYNIYSVSAISPYNKLQKIEIGPVNTQYRFRLVNDGDNYTFVPIVLTSTNKVEEAYNKLLKLFKSQSGNSLKEDIDKGLVEALNFADEIKLEIMLDLDPTNVDNLLTLIKIQKLRELNFYDSSDKVNSFYLNGNKVWLDKSTRVGLMNSLSIEKSAGNEISILWFGNNRFEIGIDSAIQMLSSLELYALNCYNTTANHKAMIENMSSIEDVKQYDYTKDYPEKLKFSL